MDIEAGKRRELISFLEGDYICIEECRLKLLGFEETLKADLVAIAREKDRPWIFAFEVKQPNPKWELKNWLNAIRQAGNYPNCIVVDERVGIKNGELITASFIYPHPDLSKWSEGDVQENRFYRDYDFEPLRGALLLAQHFLVGQAQIDGRASRLSLKIGTDPIWDSTRGFSFKSSSIFSKRTIGSQRRQVRK